VLSQVLKKLVIDVDFKLRAIRRFGSRNGSAIYPQ
jgi:hypothetical protein